MRPIWLALVLALALALAACGEDGDDVTDEAAGDAADEVEEDAADEDEGDAEESAADEDADDEGAADEGEGEADDEEPAGAEPTVAVAETELGDALVDAEGLSLYLFEEDSEGESTCYDDCADSWPPLIDEDPTADDGADEGLLGTTERDDGSAQVTYDGSPLYYWAGDAQPGDIEGQGVGDVWWLVDPAGEPIMGADEADAGGSGTGY